MDNVFKALEVLGATSFLRTVPGQQLDKILNPLDLDDAIQQAIVQRDTATLEMLLNVRNKIVCMINKPEPDDVPEQEPKPEEDEPEPVPQPVKNAG